MTAGGRLWTRLGGDRRSLARYRRPAAAAAELEPALRSLSDPELRAHAEAWQRRHRGTVGADCEDLLPEAAALVRETSRRVLGKRLDDVQLMGGLALHDGAMVEMKTGEGKTLALVLPAVLGALAGRGVHVLTANDYLVERDAALTAPLYGALGLSCGTVLEVGDGKRPSAARRAAYAADVTYATPLALGYDLLRDRRANTPERTVQRGRYLALVDEADLLLFDDARKTVHLTRTDGEADPRYAKMTAVVGRLKPGLHYRVDQERKLVTLTDAGTERIEDLLGTSDLDRTADPRLLRILDAVLRAREVFRRGVDYVVVDGAVGVISGYSGRVSLTTDFGDGVTQAIAAKEGLEVPAETRRLCTLHVHWFLRGYQRLGAITGVAAETEAYRRVYGLETVRIPTGRPVLRVDRPVRFYPSDRARTEAVVAETAARRAKGQPVLLGTASIAQSEQMSAALTERGIPHHRLTPENHAEEAAAVARAGSVGAVTVVTRMVGRGVDIQLGGGADGGADAPDPADHDAVVRSGGLYVLAVDAYESRRLELHMRGRAGRRGDPGESAVFLSVTDPSLKPLFPAWQLKVLGLNPDPADSSMAFSRGVERALDIRTGQLAQQLCESVRYDEVMERQSDRLQRQRLVVFDGSGRRDWVARALDSTADQAVAAAKPSGGAKALRRALAQAYPVGLDVESLAALPPEQLSAAVRADVHSAYARREAEVTAPVLRDYERWIPLNLIDNFWADHLRALDDLSAATSLHTLTGADGLAHYQQEAERLFTGLLRRIERRAVFHLFRQEGPE
ncbi:DEAD/DEAH box helicase [Streptacidiphilus sp. N1-12]|uniref:DEAD/DEAH box helicase n=2 Tax=Streptacidiphilus alkalitolerans TaxID=3342712 RepID=A0ABV6WK24_9ACTN